MLTEQLTGMWLEILPSPFGGINDRYVRDPVFLCVDIEDLVLNDVGVYDNDEEPR